jgi:hypothetical protein
MNGDGHPTDASPRVATAPSAQNRCDFDTARRERIRKLLANPGHYGGDTVEFIKQMRRER